MEICTEDKLKVESPQNNEVELSITQQMEISEKLEGGAESDQLSSEYNVDKSTIDRIKKRSIRVAKFADENLIGKKKRKRNPKHKELEDHLYSWYLQKRDLGDRITSDLLREKALQLNFELGGPSSFIASRCWLNSFRKRRGVDHLDDQEENDDDDEADTTNILSIDSVSKLKGIIKVQHINLENIYKLDETGLAWRCLPEMTLASSGESEEHHVERKTVSKERVTVALCANATGTHRLPALFINKYKTPRALKHCKDQLPVVYRFQKNALLDVEIFIDWYKNEFKPSVLRRQEQEDIIGKVILLVNNWWARKLPEDLLKDDKFCIIFLPPNAASTLQPRDQRVIQKIKRSFQLRMLRQILKFDGKVAEFYIDYDIKDCMDLFHEAWDNVCEYDIINDWRELLGDSTKPDDSKESSFYQNLHKVIATILGREIEASKIDDWLSTCASVEKKIEESEEPTENNPPQRLGNSQNIEKDEIDRVFRNLITWSQNEPEFIQLQAQCLKSYYDQK